MIILDVSNWIIDETDRFENGVINHVMNDRKIRFGGGGNYQPYYVDIYGIGFGDGKGGGQGIGVHIGDANGAGEGDGSCDDIWF
jgi:hypothetical protein